MRTPAAIEMAWHNTPDRGGLKKRTVKKGDYLSRICLDIYGFVNNQLIRIVKENNPAIIDADLIFTGDTIVFPELSTPDGTRTDSQWR
jgi:nucleoid-associated protein YgaU